ncbi:hypothetical protein [Phenylobacterium sp.]|uniref:hypothetical protein n=1 Tax=Phenylobacterium sp. TaxID=1871053 RepID=UPI0035B1446C
MTDEDLALAEVARAGAEIRTYLGRMAIREQLAYPLMAICTLLDRVRLCVTKEKGDNAFILNEQEGTIAFRARTIKRILQESDRLAGEFGYEPGYDRLRLMQMSINLFIVHELLHISQNFPHFASVEHIKNGLPVYGLPILDIAADTLSAWACANVEMGVMESDDQTTLLRWYSNALILAYVIGSFVFSIENSPPKKQRALSLVISALLVQALTEGTLLRDALYEGWTELSPILILNFDQTNVFNAIVIDRTPGMLLRSYQEIPGNELDLFWNSAGKSPLFDTMEFGARILVSVGAVKGAKAT